MDKPEALPGPSWTPAEIAAGAAGPLHPAALLGLAAFNRGNYFLAHEELETAWRAESGPVRDAYRGILQVGLGYYQILRGNYRGAAKMFARCKPWLGPYPPLYRGINLAQLRADAARAEAELLLLGPQNIGAFNRALMKPVQFELSSGAISPG